MNLVLGPTVLFIDQLALDTLKLNHCLLSMGLSTYTKLQLFHCHAQEKTIDNRFPRNEIRIH